VLTSAPAWSESQLKAFADSNGIPVARSPARREQPAQGGARELPQAAATKLGEFGCLSGRLAVRGRGPTRDLKRWCDERGIPRYTRAPSAPSSSAARCGRNSRLGQPRATRPGSSSVAAAAASCHAGGSPTPVFDNLVRQRAERSGADERGIKVPPRVEAQRGHRAAAPAQTPSFPTARRAARTPRRRPRTAPRRAAPANEYARGRRTDDAAGAVRGGLQSVVYDYVGWLGRQVGPGDGRGVREERRGARAGLPRRAAAGSQQGGAKAAAASAGKKASKGQEEL